MKFGRNTAIIGCLGALVVALGCALIGVLVYFLTADGTPSLQRVTDASPPTSTIELATETPLVVNPTPAEASPTNTVSPTNTPDMPEATDTPAPVEDSPTSTPEATAVMNDGDAPLKTGSMSFRYLDDVLIGKGFTVEDFEIGTIVHVLPNQVISDEFLAQEFGTSGDKIYYGETDISFDPKNPLIADQFFTVTEIEPFLKFAEPFPENMRNGWNAYFPFDVEIFAPGTR